MMVAVAWVFSDGEISGVVFSESRGRARWTVVEARCEAFGCDKASSLHAVRIRRERSFDDYASLNRHNRPLNVESLVAPAESAMCGECGLVDMSAPFEEGDACPVCYPAVEGQFADVGKKVTLPEKGGG